MTKHDETARHPIALGGVEGAAEALRGVVVRTPLLENADANAELGDGERNQLQFR